VWIGTAFKQEGHHLPVAPTSGESERSRSKLLVDRVDVRAVIEYNFAFGRLPSCAMSCKRVVRWQFMWLGFMPPAIRKAAISYRLK
jgi:hypothetical protein